MEIKIGYKDGAEFANRKYVLDCSHFPVIVARCALKGQKAPESGKSFLLGCRFYDEGRELELDMFWQRANDLTPSKKYGYYRYLKIREGQRLNVDRRFVIPPRADYRNIIRKIGKRRGEGHRFAFDFRGVYQTRRQTLGIPLLRRKGDQLPLYAESAGKKGQRRFRADFVNEGKTGRGE